MEFKLSLVTYYLSDLGWSNLSEAQLLLLRKNVFFLCRVIVRVSRV